MSEQKFIENLKSSMDRFIVAYNVIHNSSWIYLKSSMDRFIAYEIHRIDKRETNLKSSMDRFIAVGQKLK